MESKLKIEAKDINLDLNKLVNKENLFKIENKFKQPSYFYNLTKKYSNKR